MRSERHGEDFVTHGRDLFVLRFYDKSVGFRCAGRQRLFHRVNFHVCSHYTAIVQFEAGYVGIQHVDAPEVKAFFLTNEHRVRSDLGGKR